MCLSGYCVIPRTSRRKFIAIQTGYVAVASFWVTEKRCREDEAPSVILLTVKSLTDKRFPSMYLEGDVHAVAQRYVVPPSRDKLSDTLRLEVANV